MRCARDPHRATESEKSEAAGVQHICLGLVVLGERERKLARTLCTPEQAECRISLAGTESALAKLYLERKQYRKSVGADERSLAILEKSLGPENAALVPGLASLASSYLGLKRFSEAESNSRPALTIAGPELMNSSSTADAALALGLALEGQHRIHEAEPYFQQAIAIQEHSGHRQRAICAEHPTLRPFSTRQKTNHRSAATRNAGPLHPPTDGPKGRREGTGAGERLRLR